ncbi:MAG: hypothetical protein GEU80_12010 [Dehalococcoidia bacterium]|nr:hypothetical protein [Dehalococcoidia bacterium]
MHIVICAKEMLESEGVNSYALRGRLTVDESGRSFDTGGTVPNIINAYDEQALEAAPRLRDAGVDCRITAVTVGREAGGQSCAAVSPWAPIKPSTSLTLTRTSRTACGLPASCKRSSGSWATSTW